MNEPDLELIRDYLDDRITLERLNRLLETDADARAQFLVMATFEEGLRDFSVAGEFSFPDHKLFATEHEPERRTEPWCRFEHIGMAALFLVCLGLSLLLLKNSDRVPGVSGQTLAFEDQNVSVDLSEHISTLAQLDAFTFATWGRDSGEPLAILFSLSGDSEQHRLQFYLSSRFVRFGWQDGLHYDSISGRVDGWNSGQWYHVAVIAEGGVVRLYRDGELLASGSIGSKIATPVSTPSMVKNRFPRLPRSAGGWSPG